MMDAPKTRFPLILLGSMLLHVAVLGVLYGTWFFHAALKFGEFTFGDDGQAQYEIANIDRTKPLFLPRGFYAVEKPPVEVKKPEKPKNTTDDEKKASKKPERDDQKDARKDPDKPESTAPNPKFGHISGNAFRPHLENIYHAYEQGRITITTFTVTVSCKAERDGSLSDIVLVKSSGDDLIDTTAVNIVKELGAMKALGPLYELSSLSITLDKTPTSATLTAVGFASDPSVTQDFATQLSALKFAARFKMVNPDQTRLLDNVQISDSGNRVSVSLGLPTTVAGDMMRRSFGSTAQVRPAN